MERKLRISYNSFEKLLVRFVDKFAVSSIRKEEVRNGENYINILGLCENVFRNYKTKSFRKHSGFSYKVPETSDIYKMSYTFEKENGCLKLHFKLHVRKKTWSRNKRIAIMSIRLNNHD